MFEPGCQFSSLSVLKIYQIGWKYIENFSRHETTYGFP